LFSSEIILKQLFALGSVNIVKYKSLIIQNVAKLKSKHVHWLTGIKETIKYVG